MSTSYDTVNSYFLQKVQDYSFVNLATTDLDTMLQGYMHSAATKFKRCQQDLTQYNDTTRTLTSTLTDQELEILSMLMIVEYLTPKIITTELIRQSISNRDWSMTSQANHLKELIDARETLKREINTLIVNYTYDNQSNMNKLVTQTGTAFTTNNPPDSGDGNSGSFLS